MSLLAETRRKARYGHKDWLLWTSRDGKEVAERLTADSMKRCLLDVGTKGKWTLVCANDGILMRGFWRMGLNLFHQRRRGE